MAMPGYSITFEEPSSPLTPPALLKAGENEKELLLVGLAAVM